MGNVLKIHLKVDYDGTKLPQGQEGMVIVNRQGVWGYIQGHWCEICAIKEEWHYVPEEKKEVVVEEEKVMSIFEEYGIKDVCAEVEVFKGWDYEI